METFPDLPGLTWPVVRRPLFKTVGTTAADGTFYGATYWQYPLYEFDLRFNYLEPAHFDLLIGLFLQSRGNITPFWFDAGAGDNAVDQQALGAGDGVATEFTLVRATGGFVQPVDGSFGVRTAYVDGGAVSAVFDDTTVTFDVAPAAGTALAWSGSYYYKCRFLENQLQTDEFLAQLYQGQLTLRSTR